MEGAQTRDLLVMAGGEDAAFARARPLSDAIAKRVIHTGAIGTGSIAKIMHNCASFTLDMLIAECWTTGSRPASTRATIVRVVQRSRARPDDEPQGAAAGDLSTRRFRAALPLALAKKDLGLAMDLARETKTPMRLASLCDQEFDGGDRSRLGRARRLDRADLAGGARPGRGSSAA